MNEAQQQLRDIVRKIADDISNPSADAEWWKESSDYEEGQEPSGYDYITEVLDIEYIVNANEEYIAANITVGIGGPNIYINTQYNRVEGYWWGDQAYANYTDNLGIDDDVEELYSITR